MKNAAVTWDPSINLTAYNEVESSKNYSTPEELDRYRRLLLEKSGPAAQCVKKAVYRGAKIKVLELCSGSSRLLYALDDLGLIEEGYGVEVSLSRHLFAEEWKSSRKAARVQNIHCSADAYEFPHAGLDLVVLIDGALSYLYPCDPALPERILRRAHASLAPGGALLLEFDVLSQEQRAAMTRNGSNRIWRKGDEKDAFAYALYETEPVNWEQMVVQNTSIYLSRSTKDEKVKRELYKYYSAEELNALLDKVGFTVRHCASFEMEPYTPRACALITLAGKR